MDTELFPPKPGGMVDTARKTAQAATEQASEPDTAVDDQGLPAIRVAGQGADVFAARTLNLSPGQTAILLPEDRNRKRATFQVVTTGMTVALSPSYGNAENGQGFQLRQGDSTVFVECRGILYVNNPNATAVSVTVLSELYSPGV